MISPFLAEFIAGWVGGCAYVVVGYPFDTVKVRQQHFSTSLLVAARETFKHEGWMGFFKGMAAPLVSYGPSNSLFFGCFGLFMRNFNGTGPEDPSHINKRGQYFVNLFYAGCFAGFAQVVMMCPFDMVKISMQTSTEGKSKLVHNYSEIKYRLGSKEAFKTIYRIKGIKGLYRGLLPMLLRDVPTSGLYFVVYERLVPDDRNNVHWYHKVWGGGWAGIASVSVVLPVDVVKTRLQADDLLHPYYQGTTDCILKLYREEGPRIFWKGLPIITARAFPAHAMLFVGYEMAMDILGVHMM